MKKLIVPIAFLFFAVAFSVQAEGASLFLFPGSESFIMEDSFSVEVKVDTVGIPINAVQATVYFPLDKLEVLNISKESSIFTLWPEEPEFSNFSGEISFSGGTPHPGFSGIGNIITINFKAKKEGMVNLTLGEGQVLADDGKGTNILVFIKEAKYFIYQPEKIGLEATTTLPRIFSSTHSNENEWYSNNTPRFQWSLIKDIKEVSFVLDKNQNTTPDTISEGLLNFKNYDLIPDGIWYFHLRLGDESGWGETFHYRIQVDTNPPHPFEIIIDNAGDSTNPKPNLYFETKDDTSGIDIYKIKIGEEKFIDLMLAQINPFPISLLRPGNYKIIVRAIDKAKNIVRTKTFLNIDPIETPEINIWPEKYVAGEETFYIEGTALPEVEITIFLKKNEKVIKEWQTFSNSQGEWSFSTKDLIKSGTYYLSAQAKDKRGAVSEVTIPETVEISLSGLALGPILITFKTLALIFVLISILGILIFGFLVFRIRQSKKILKKETKEAKESVRTSFEGLRKEIEKRIEMLDSRPGFTEKERKVCDELKETLKVAEESVSKEIKDIEKELE
jgi:hypothetical protein